MKTKYSVRYSYRIPLTHCMCGFDGDVFWKFRSKAEAVNYAYFMTLGEPSEDWVPVVRRTVETLFAREVEYVRIIDPTKRVVFSTKY